MKKSRTYETRYRHKLNMLAPGTAMLKWGSLLLALGLALFCLRLNTAACVALGLFGILLAVLIVLLAIEAHQDKVLNEIAARENQQAESSRDS